jgi:hypothetical protein
MRTPQIDRATIPQQHNPKIDLGIPVYDVPTRTLIKSLVNFKNRARVYIAERRNAQGGLRRRDHRPDVVRRRAALENASDDGSVKGLQLLDDAGSVAAIAAVFEPTTVPRCTPNASSESLELSSMVNVGGSPSLHGLDRGLESVLLPNGISPFPAGAIVGDGVGPDDDSGKGCTAQVRQLRAGTSVCAWELIEER